MAKMQNKVENFRLPDGNYEIPVIVLQFHKLQNQYCRLAHLQVRDSRVLVPKNDPMLAQKIWDSCGDPRELDRLNYNY